MSVFSNMMGEVNKAGDSLDAVSAAFGSGFVLGAGAASGGAAGGGGGAAAPAEGKAVTWLKTLQGKWGAADMPGMLEMVDDSCTIVNTGLKGGSKTVGTFFGKKGWVNWIVNGWAKDFMFQSFRFSEFRGDDTMAYCKFRARAVGLKSGGIPNNEIMAFQEAVFNAEGKLMRMMIIDGDAEETKRMVTGRVVCKQTIATIKPGSQKAIIDEFRNMYEYMEWEGLLGGIHYFESDTKINFQSFWESAEHAEKATDAIKKLLGERMSKFMAGPPEMKTWPQAFFFSGGGCHFFPTYVEVTKVTTTMDYDAIALDDRMVGLYGKAAAAQGLNGAGWGQIWDGTNMITLGVFNSKEAHAAAKPALDKVWGEFAPMMAAAPEQTFHDGVSGGGKSGVTCIAEVEFVAPEAKAGFAAWNKQTENMLPGHLNLLVDNGPNKCTVYQCMTAKQLCSNFQAFIDNKEMRDGFMSMFKSWNAKFYGTITAEVQEKIAFMEKSYPDKCTMKNANSEFGTFGVNYLINPGSVHPAMAFVAYGEFKPGMKDEFSELLQGMQKEMNNAKMSNGWFPQGENGMRYVEVSTKEAWVEAQTLIGKWMMANKIDMSKYFTEWNYCPCNPDDEVKEMCKGWDAQPWCNVLYPQVHSIEANF